MRHVIEVPSMCHGRPKGNLLFIGTVVTFLFTIDPNIVSNPQLASVDPELIICKRMCLPGGALQTPTLKDCMSMMSETEADAVQFLSNLETVPGGASRSIPTSSAIFFLSLSGNNDATSTKASIINLKLSSLLFIHLFVILRAHPLRVPLISPI